MRSSVVTAVFLMLPAAGGAQTSLTLSIPASPYQRALSGEMSAKEESLIRERLTALTGSTAAPAHGEWTLSPPNAKKLDGDAVFNTMFSLPDDGPEKIIRRASVTCHADGQAACSVSVLSSKERGRARLSSPQSAQRSQGAAAPPIAVD
jgi:hypothetical protein